MLPLPSCPNFSALDSPGEHSESFLLRLCLPSPTLLPSICDFEGFWKFTDLNIRRWEFPSFRDSFPLGPPQALSGKPRVFNQKFSLCQSCTPLEHSSTLPVPPISAISLPLQEGEVKVSLCFMDLHSISWGHSTLLCPPFDLQIFKLKSFISLSFLLFLKMGPLSLLMLCFGQVNISTVCLCVCVCVLFCWSHLERGKYKGELRFLVFPPSFLDKLDIGGWVNNQVPRMP